MDLTAILAQLLNPNGSQSILGAPQPSVQGVGDHANPALMQAQMARFSQPPAIQQPTQNPGLVPTQNQGQAQMPPQAPQGQPMPQTAPQAAPVDQGGGAGDFLTNLFAPKQAAKTRTVGWLQEQGLDQGTATVLASDKGALRTYMLQRAKGAGPTEFDQRAQAAQQYGMKPGTPEFNTFVLGNKLDAPQREIKNDANGTPRFVDTGEPVYPGDQNTGKEMFTGKSVEAQGLNFLISQGTLSKGQAANVAAGKQVTGPNGEIIFMTPQGIFQQPSAGGAPQPVGGSAAPQSGNIPITGPKYSEDMRKAGGFAMRADAADKIVADPKVTAAGGSYSENLKNAAPFGLGNYLTSDQFQSFDQAQRDFVNAVLRRESGAAISESEFQNARKQYLPQPGDGKVVLDQKAANRKMAIQSLQSSADPVPSLATPPAAPSAAPAPAGNAPSFGTNKDVFDAIQTGKLKIGDEIIVNGKRMRVDP